MYNKYLHPYLPISHHNQVEECHHTIWVVIEIKQNITKFCQEKTLKQ